MEGETRFSGSRLSPQLAFVWWQNENESPKKKKNLFRETPTSPWVPFRGKFRPLGPLYNPSHPLAWSLIHSYPLSAQQRLWSVFGGCPGWSESSLGTRSFCRGSYVLWFLIYWCTFVTYINHYKCSLDYACILCRRKNKQMKFSGQK